MYNDRGEWGFIKTVSEPHVLMATLSAPNFRWDTPRNNGTVGCKRTATSQGRLFEYDDGKLRFTTAPPALDITRYCHKHTLVPVSSW